MSHNLQEGLAKAGVAKAERHLFVCIGPDCCSSKEGDALWQHIKDRVKQCGVKIMRTKAACFRICTGGPWIVIYPDGAWYGRVTAARFDRILQEHILRGNPVREWMAAQNQLNADITPSGERRVVATG